MKTYDEKGTIRDGSDVLLVAYEMAQEVPTNNYSTYTSSYSSSYYSSNKNLDKDKASTYSYFDLLIGTKKLPPPSTSSYSMNPTYAGSSYVRDLGFRTAGYPIRLAYEKGVTTRKDVHRLIFEAVKVAYDLPDAYSTTRVPYVIHATSLYATLSKGVVNLDDAKGADDFTLSSYECLLCCWNTEALGEDDSSTDDSGSGDEANEQDGVTVSAVEVDIPHVDSLMVSRWLGDGINCTSVGKAGVGHKKGGAMNVMQCFEKFIEREQMPAEETWYCPECKQHLAPIKKFDIWSAPEILVVHLKRFQYSSRASFTYREKVNDLVDFPIEGLDLSEYVKSSQSANERTPAIYDLYGVSEHSGSMGGGHYTAKCKNDQDGKWYSFNDAYVQECTAESAISAEAYVLFYKRRHGHLKWGGLVPSVVPLEK